MNAKQNRVAKRKRLRNFPEGCYVKVTVPRFGGANVSYGHLFHYSAYPCSCRVRLGNGNAMYYVPFRYVERAEEPK